MIGNAIGRILVAAVVFWAGLACRAEAGTPVDFTAIDAFISAEMVRAGIPGGALVIVRGNQIVHLRGFGVADPSGSPVTEATPFILGSTGKAITAFAVMQLAEKGLVELDLPIGNYLPWFRLGDTSAHEHITIRHLLNHTSGIPASAGLVLQDDDSVDEKALARHVHALASYNAVAAPGKKFQYSNANYTTLGAIIEVVVGTTYEAYIEKEVFAPLGMDRSFTSKEEAVTRGLATGFRQWFTYPVASGDLPFVRGELPAGYHISTAADMGRWLIAQLNGGQVGSARVISAASISAMHTPAIAVSAEEQYGMGWRIGKIGEVLAVAHGGAIPNYLSDVVLLPDQGWGVAWLTNSSNMLFGARMMTIADNVARMLLCQPVVDTPVQAAAWAALAALALLSLGMIALATASVGRSMAGRARRGLGATVLALALGGFIASVLLVGIPALLGVPIQILMLFQPDFGVLLVCGAVLSLVWALARALEEMWSRGQLRANAA